MEINAIFDLLANNKRLKDVPIIYITAVAFETIKLLKEHDFISLDEEKGESNV